MYFGRCRRCTTRAVKRSPRESRSSNADRTPRGQHVGETPAATTIIIRRPTPTLRGHYRRRVFFIVLRLDLYCDLDVVSIIIPAKFITVAISVITVRISGAVKIIVLILYIIKKIYLAAVFDTATMQIAVFQARSFSADNAKPVSCTLDQYKTLFL